MREVPWAPRWARTDTILGCVDGAFRIVPWRTRATGVDRSRRPTTGPPAKTRAAFPELTNGAAAGGGSSGTQEIARNAAATAKEPRQKRKRAATNERTAAKKKARGDSKRTAAEKRSAATNERTAVRKQAPQQKNRGQRKRAAGRRDMASAGEFRGARVPTTSGAGSRLRRVQRRRRALLMKASTVASRALPGRELRAAPRQPVFGKVAEGAAREPPRLGVLSRRATVLLFAHRALVRRGRALGDAALTFDRRFQAQGNALGSAGGAGGRCPHRRLRAYS